MDQILQACPCMYRRLLTSYSKTTWSVLGFTKLIVVCVSLARRLAVHRLGIWNPVVVLL